MGLDIRHILAPHIILNHISKKLGDVDLVYISISLNLTRLDALGGSVKSAFNICAHSFGKLLENGRKL
jgi:hypothetical protein